MARLFNPVIRQEESEKIKLNIKRQVVSFMSHEPLTLEKLVDSKEQRQAIANGFIPSLRK